MVAFKRSLSIISASLFAATLFTSSVIPASAESTPTVENPNSDIVLQESIETPVNISISDESQPSNSLRAVIGSTNFSTGQGGMAFEFKGKAAGENVQLAIKNSSNNPFSMKLISPSGFVWLDVTVAANSSTTYPMWWTSSQSGWWIIDTDPIGGYPYSGSYQVRVGL